MVLFSSCWHVNLGNCMEIGRDLKIFSFFKLMKCYCYVNSGEMPAIMGGEK